MTDLLLTNVYKSFGDVDVLKDINIEVEKGEFVVFVGPSGCGKSTLLRLIAGLEDVTTGDVMIDGKHVNNVPPSKRGIAMVFQSYALYPHLNVRNNMSLALKQERQSKTVINQRIEKASKMLNLEAYLDRLPAELSGGQRQRVAISRAIVREPKLFLFDEPLSNLDAALRMNTRLEIANIHNALGTSMIYVTHDQTEAMTLADKIVVLRDGRVEQIGSPMALYNNPCNQFVAGFLGSPAMNFMAGTCLNKPHAHTLGIRPEDITIGDGQGLTATIEHIEQLGGDTNIVTQVNGQQITARLFGQYQFQKGQTITLNMPDEKLFYFDEQGLRVMQTTT